MKIEGALIRDTKTLKAVDVVIEKGKILEIKPSAKKGRFLLFEGICDCNVKLQDDKVNAKNIQDLIIKANKGGVSKAILNPRLTPQIDNEIILEFIKSQNSDLCEICPLIEAVNEKGLSEIAILLKKGGAGIYFNSNISSLLICRIFEYAKMYNIPLHCRARNSSIKSVGVMHDGEVSSKLGLGGICEIEEISEVAKIIEFAKFYDVEVVFKSISTARSVELIKKAKEYNYKSR